MQDGHYLKVQQNTQISQIIGWKEMFESVQGDQ